VPLIPIILILLGVVVFVLAMPFLLYLRYRAGTMRRRAYKWLATVSLISFGLSAALFVWAASITNFWVPHAFSYSLAGIIAGSLLGLLGLALTRWEKTPRTFHYTPNRWLVLLITLAVVARLIYGGWRIWHAWRIGPGDGSWLASSGLAGSMGVGAVVVGYYFSYFAGVRWRLRNE
jgi:hypothetical protein